PAALHGLARLAGDAFDRAIDARPLEALPAEWRGVDVAVDLHGKGPASHRILLALAPKRLIAFANAEIPASAGGARFDDDEHEVKRWCRMLAHADVAADPSDLALAVPAEPPAMRGATIVHAGAASESRRWPIERWAAVVRHCEARGERVVLTGDASERDRADALARATGLGAERVLAGRTSLVQLAALVAHARRVVAGDTGIAHLASAYATPSIVLFGPTSPAHWGPPAASRHRVLWAGRTGDPHAAVVDPGLLAIDVRDVVTAISGSER
ncbi:MAG: glycosyltransferase family 9 protein, partial [Candidatus Eremiobacteraeota bacterium]|nr:glycosyltransferase family 9 protein [Candidatus Eremiobacteraeota bacterium]